MEKSWPFTVARKILMVVSNVLKYCIILIYAKIHSVFPSGVPFLHTLFLENKVQASGKKIRGNVVQLKWRSHAKIQLIWSKKQKQPK